MFSPDADPQYQAIAKGLQALQEAAPRFPAGPAAAVRAALDAAFPKSAPPEKDELFEGRPDPANARAAALFAGKDRESLDLETLRRHWSLVAGFAPKAWAYYLPALLRAALGDGCRRAFLHSVLFMLQPEWYYLYEDPAGAHGRDAALDEAQRAAVARFLELALEAPGTLTWTTETALPYGMAERELHGAERQFRWMALQALEWRYNAVETPALAKARAAYRVLRTAGIPDPDGPAGAVAALIRSAFASAPPPAAADMTDSAQGDEPFEYAVEFRGRDWRTLSAEFLSAHSPALSFFSRAAFRYFIPAYMLGELKGLDWNADPVFALTHGLAAEDKEGESTYDWESLAKAKFSVFSPEERAAIAAFLRFVDARYEGREPRVREALDSYWLKPV